MRLHESPDKRRACVIDERVQELKFRVNLVFYGGLLLALWSVGGGLFLLGFIIGQMPDLSTDQTALGLLASFVLMGSALYLTNYIKGYLRHLRRKIEGLRSEYRELVK